jgi:glycosyltransferase involved in cell wall biosynthesis
MNNSTPLLKALFLEGRVPYRYKASFNKFKDKRIPAINLKYQTYILSNKIKDIFGIRRKRNFKLASVIVLTYNNIKFTKITLNSIIKSTKFPYELIIVDNGSDKETLDWLEHFKKVNSKYTNIKIIKRNPKDNWTREKKIYSAKNVAIKEAKGDLIAVSDNDVKFRPYWLFYATDIMNIFPKAGLVGLQIPGYHGYNRIIKKNRHKIYEMDTIEGCLLVFSKKTYDLVGPFKEGPQKYPGQTYTGCDYEYTKRIVKFGLFNAVPVGDLIEHMQQPRGKYK